MESEAVVVKFFIADDSRQILSVELPQLEGDMFLLLKTLCTMVAIWNDVFSIDYQKLFTQAHICTSFLLSLFF